MKNFLNAISFCFFNALFLCLTATTAQATLVARLNMQQLVEDSDYIVKLKITDKRTDFDAYEAGTYVTYYTGTILECLKCPARFADRIENDPEFTFKQIAANPNNKRLFHGSDFDVDATYVVCLPEAHPRTGLLAPVGLDQGKFKVVTRNGVESVPALKQRTRLLRAHIDPSRNRDLLLRADDAESNPTYANFKTLIQAAQ